MNDGRRSTNAGVADLHDFDILNMLGEGAFGKVLLRAINVSSEASNLPLILGLLMTS